LYLDISFLYCLPMIEPFPHIVQVFVAMMIFEFKNFNKLILSLSLYFFNPFTDNKYFVTIGVVLSYYLLL